MVILFTKQSKTGNIPTMPRKKSIKEKFHHGRTNVLDLIAEHGRWCSHLIYPSGTTKSWLTPSRRCSKISHHHLQLTELDADSSSTIGSSQKLLSRYVLNYPGESLSRRRWTDKSMTIDPYDAKNQVMKINYIIKLRTNRKFYAVSLQGSFVEMEKIDDGKITVTGLCKTRAVPSSTNVKYFREYLIESRGEVLLVFLVYRKSCRDIEVYKLDIDSFQLVKVDRLRGRTLFIEDEYCQCVESGVTRDCVLFTSAYENYQWWMYDFESRSIFPESLTSCSPKSIWGAPRIEE